MRLTATAFLLCALSLTASAQTTGPRLMQQQPDGESDPKCCVVALSNTFFFPMLYLGNPLPVGPLRFNYVGVQATGIPDETPVTVILDGPERYEIPAIAWPIIGWPGATNVLWFAPPCAHGQYKISIRHGERESPPLLIRFSSNCEIPAELRPSRAGR